MADDIHGGHRERVKEKFMKHGLDSFEAHEVLELLLFYAIPRRDTNEIAHRLIATFGSLSGVLDASAEDLRRVEGVGSHAASLIALCRQMLQRYQTEKSTLIKINSSNIVQHLEAHFLGETREKAIALFLNGRSERVGCVTLSKGSIIGTDICAREIAEAAFRVDATAVILAHNHPAGNALPSTEDINTTRDLIAALRPMNLILLNHYIFAPDSHFSMRDDPHTSLLFSKPLT